MKIATLIIAIALTAVCSFGCNASMNGEAKTAADASDADGTGSTSASVEDERKARLEAEMRLRDTRQLAREGAAEADAQFAPRSTVTTATATSVQTVPQAPPAPSAFPQLAPQPTAGLAGAPALGLNAITPHPAVCMLPQRPNTVHLGASPSKRMGVACEGCVEIRASSRAPKWMALIVDGQYVFACSGGQALSSQAIIPRPDGSREPGYLYITRTPAISKSMGPVLNMYMGPGEHDVTALYFMRTPSGVFYPVSFEKKTVNYPAYGRGTWYFILGTLAVRPIDQY